MATLGNPPSTQPLLGVYNVDQVPSITFQAGATINNFDPNFVASIMGTFTANGATPVTVANTNVTANSIIIPTLKTVGGTVGAIPAIKTITPGTGFTIAATAADTSVYNYVILG